jgi:hypothetical protein
MDLKIYNLAEYTKSIDFRQNNVCDCISVRLPHRPPRQPQAPPQDPPRGEGRGLLYFGQKRIFLVSVLRIRDVYPRSRISDPKTAMKDRGEKKFVDIPFFGAINFTKLKLFYF